MYKCFQYLSKNGYELKEYKRDAFGIDHNAPNENVTEYRKDFGEYMIVVRSCENDYGGRGEIEVHMTNPKGLPKPNHSFHHMACPGVRFFATGFHDYESFEKRVKEEIVPKLKSWAIEVL
jgi:hypothetical protein